MIFIGLAIGMVVGTIITLVLMEIYVKKKVEALETHSVIKGKNGFSVELLPCSHCGANNQELVTKIIDDVECVSIRCITCGIQTGFFKNPVDAILSWNARTINSNKFN